MEDNGIIPTITPSARNFLAHVPGIKQPLNRFMLGVESLVFQGFPVELLPKSEAKASDPQYQDLAGNAFPATCILAIMLAMRVHVLAQPSVPDSHDVPDSQASRASGALSLMELFGGIHVMKGRRLREASHLLIRMTTLSQCLRQTAGKVNHSGVN